MPTKYNIKKVMQLAYIKMRIRQKLERVINLYLLVDKAGLIPYSYFKKPKKKNENNITIKVYFCYK